MDIYQTKAQIHSLFDYYYQKDDKGNLQKIENNINTIVKNSKK